MSVPWKFLGLFLVGSLNTSFVSSSRMGLITDDFGIVTKSDLDEEEARCTATEPFPPKQNLCFQYWQCLPTENTYIDCEDIGDLGGVGDFEHTGLAHFWIQDRNSIHHYLTRRNFSMDACWEWRDEWRSVMQGERIVCLSGDFIEMSNDDDPGSPTGTHYYWIIDQMKSRHGRWSYFYRNPKTWKIQGYEEPND